MFAASQSLEGILIVVSVLLLLSVFVSRLTNIVGIPALLVFLSIGMLAGSEGLGGIYFDDARLSQHLGVVALAFILFSGGLSTEWARVRSVFWQGLSLSTLGVVVSTVLVGLFCHAALGLPLLEGLLLGAIASSTDAAAVFSILRSKGISLRRKLSPLLELESGSNDPMAIFLTVALTQMGAISGQAAWALVPSFFVQMIIGAGLGLLFGKLSVMVINAAELDHEGLYPVLSVAAVALTYGVTAECGGNGFLAVYLAGIIMGNDDFIHKRSLMAFHDGLAWLMQIVMFLALGLLVFPTQVIDVAGVGLVLSVFLLIVARPLSVWVSLFFSNLSMREILMISWVGLRGAAPIILATFPLLAGLPHASHIFNVVFFIVITSVLIQGPAIPFVARLLHADAPSSVKKALPLYFDPAARAKSNLTAVIVSEGSPAMGKRIVDLGLPRGVLIVLIERKGEYHVPHGASVLDKGDTLLLFVPKSHQEEMERVFGGTSE